jgi:hypothetical protein
LTKKTQSNDLIHGIRLWLLNSLFQRNATY